MQPLYDPAAQDAPDTAPGPPRRPGSGHAAGAGTRRRPNRGAAPRTDHGAGADTDRETGTGAQEAAPAAGSAGSDAAGSALGAAVTASAAAGGRAARRRAAKQRSGGGGGGGRRRAGGRHDSRTAGRGGHRARGHRARGHRAGDEPWEQEQEQEQETGSAGESAPLTRMEARRAARAARPSASVVASRVIGELFISIGVMMLLFVTYQLWWTNVRAHEEADGAAHSLQDDWANGKGKPGVFAPGQGFAIMHIPKLDVVVPIAEGTDKHRVLDRGMVGHYGGPNDIQTAMPDAKTGNFAVAGHRNTHGEPFRYINRLTRGDVIVVETQDTYYVYKVTSMLPQTPPSNIGVIGPVPPGSGFTGPGRYITLTTCTPEYTSKYRLIVWGKMVEQRPRSKGKPTALVN
ncbi:class E sortase [Streptomyces sulfonofaciens]|uniref:class E sortase n=1 Tax=Streptomyces sulfonofaciens TaxID=68272 RepID=UPI0027E3E08D|nr:class E sortase [Streptomyces sulfonofaciens]